MPKYLKNWFRNPISSSFSYLIKLGNFNLLIMPCLLSFFPAILAFRDNDGNPMVLPVVAKVEKQLADQIADKTLNHEYLSIDGLKSFTDAACRLALGPDSPAIVENRVRLLTSFHLSRIRSRSFVRCKRQTSVITGGPIAQGTVVREM